MQAGVIQMMLKLGNRRQALKYYNQNDVEKAKKLLSESSYNNEKIVLVTTPEYNEMYNATLVVQEQLKAAGFNAEVES